MRKLICLFLCILMLAAPVLAFDGITSAQSQTVVSNDGTCQVSITATLQLTSSSSDLSFPLPENASDIAVNLPRAKITRSGGHRNVDLSSLGAGIHTLTFRYTLSDAVTADENGNLTLTVPLICGFSLPIDRMEFSIELPGEPEKRPSFTSTYLDIAESAIALKINGSVITGVTTQRLLDQESLTMTLPVSKSMFPRVSTGRWSLNTVDLLMAVCFFLALVYWLLTMRCLPPRRNRRALPTPGLNAGEIPCRLSGQGLDLTLAVLSWAQMGYLRIQSDKRGRILLHKRMEMGNERSDLENRLFSSLFNKKDTADATSGRYAQLCRKAMGYRNGISLTYKPRSGNPRVLRFLAVVIGTLGGVSLGLALAQDTAWKIVWSIFFGILCTAAGWQMQAIAKDIFHRHKLPLLLGVGCSLIWFFLSLLAGEWHTGLFVIFAQLLIGLAASFGGRRTENGQQTMSEILGLHKFMHTATAEELQRILDTNPHYFHDLAPYALALDADRAFARRFGDFQLPECPYLATGKDSQMTVKEWAQLLRSVADAMDARQRRQTIDRLLRKWVRL